MNSLKNKLVIFPRTPHLIGSNISDSEDIKVSFQTFIEAYQIAKTIIIQEKIDGSNARVQFDGVNEPLVGNRDKVLVKGYQRKETPAKTQFRSFWGYIYDHKESFRKLTRLLGGTPVVFGEWLCAKHTIHYTNLPTLFMPFDLYLDNKFLDPIVTIQILNEAGFCTPQQLFLPKTTDHEVLKTLFDPLSIDCWKIMANDFTSSYYNGKKEGIYIKLGNGQELTHRFKVVADWFTPRTDFNETPLEKNKLKDK